MSVHCQTCKVHGSTQGDLAGAQPACNQLEEVFSCNWSAPGSDCQHSAAATSNRLLVLNALTFQFLQSFVLSRMAAAQIN